MKEEASATSPRLHNFASFEQLRNDQTSRMQQPERTGESILYLYMICERRLLLLYYLELKKTKFYFFLPFFPSSIPSLSTYMLQLGETCMTMTRERQYSVAEKQA